MTAELRAEPFEPLPGVNAPERVAVLERVEQLTGVADAALDRVARVAAGLLSAPSAYVTLVGSDQQLSPGAAEVDHDGEPMRQLPLNDSICQFQVVTGEPLVIEDARNDRLTQHNATVLDGTIGSYAGVPLRSDDGHVLGSLCVIDRGPRRWDQGALALLEDLAVVVSRDIEQRLAARHTAELERAAERVLEQVPPHTHAVTGLVELAEIADDPQLQRFAARARASSSRLMAETSRLARVTEVPPAARAATTSLLDLRRAVERAAAGARQATGTTAIHLDLAAAPIPVQCDPMRLERSLVHLFVSALHHAPEDRAMTAMLAPGDPAGQRERTAELVLSAGGTRVPAAELGRLVARFAGVVEACDDRNDAPAALRMAGGAVHATSGPVTASSSRDGLVFRARWVLAGGDPLVIDLR